MADTAFGIVEKLIKLGLKIQEQAKTARQNEQECQSLEQDVAILIGFLSLLQRNREVISHPDPAITAMLLGLEKSLDNGLSLVTDCQRRNALRRFLRAGNMSRQLCQVRNDIQWKMGMGTFATNVLQLELTVTLTKTIHYYGAHPPPLTQLQDGGVAAISYGSHLTTNDARSGVNSEITMVETGSEVTYAPSSRLTIPNSSEEEATMHHFSEENISGEGGHYVLKQKIVLKVRMSCDRSRSQAMALVARSDGISSVAIAGNDQLVVVGVGFDAVRLVSSLRKKVGQATIMILQLGEAKREKKPVEPSEEEQERMGDCKPGGVASAAARQHGRSYSSSEVTGQDKPEDAKVGVRKSKKGWPMMACRTLWRQLRRGNKSGATVAAKKAQRR
ncbi:hypothetical protein U9M48_001650 [Paspalum notatum var. saurae]|uniref:Mixed lineage kinase domain-containing protein n=1 Tax=Paspalum notatum var. saurae TaxID=547442 RepID=A0AAQ3PF48_PASNO